MYPRRSPDVVASSRLARSSPDVQLLDNVPSSFPTPRTWSAAVRDPRSERDAAVVTAATAAVTLPRDAPRSDPTPKNVSASSVSASAAAAPQRPGRVRAVTAGEPRFGRSESVVRVVRVVRVFAKNGRRG